eukprot:TRINITY_DN2870_c0_g1_i2.p1 TRINITY_DN2870_c0_g1~~TRINITY_DN2870_c0_g1_i2.p1  ORF type:complete len:861 (+),score=173.66 TRINITY_DN2870_c0_g1_i2:50-2632(+)
MLHLSTSLRAVKSETSPKKRGLEFSVASEYNPAGRPAPGDIPFDEFVAVLNIPAASARTPPKPPQRQVWKPDFGIKQRQPPASQHGPSSPPQHGLSSPPQQSIAPLPPSAAALPPPAAAELPAAAAQHSPSQPPEARTRRQRFRIVPTRPPQDASERKGQADGRAKQPPPAARQKPLPVLTSEGIIEHDEYRRQRRRRSRSRGRAAQAPTLTPDEGIEAAQMWAAAPPSSVACVALVWQRRRGCHTSLRRAPADPPRPKRRRTASVPRHAQEDPGDSDGEQTPGGEPAAVVVVALWGEKPVRTVLSAGSALLPRILGAANVTKLTMNAPQLLRHLQTDARDAVTHEVRSGRFFDVSVAAWLLDSSNPCRDVSDVCRSLGSTCPEAHADQLEGVLADAQALHGAWERAREELQREGLTRIFECTETPLSAVLGEMSAAGCRVNAAGVHDGLRAIESRLSEVSAEAERILGKPIVLLSPSAVAAALFESPSEGGLGLQDPIRRSMKAASTTGQSHTTCEESLQMLRHVHPLPSLVLEYRHLAHLRSFIENIQGYAEAGGTVHTTFMQTATATGRITTHNPNLQNLPRKDTDVLAACSRGLPAVVSVRSGLVAGPGKVLLSSDYDQMELRILAHYSGDETLVKAFNSGHDVHRTIAALLYDAAPEQVSDPQRTNAKRLVYGIMYGMGPARVGRTLGVSEEAAAGFMSRFLGRFPGLQAFANSAVSACRRTGRVQTLLRRYRRLDGILSTSPAVAKACERKAVNAIIQGSASDVLKVALLKVDRALQGLRQNRGVLEFPRRPSGLASSQARPIMQVHDEIICEADASVAEEVGGLLKREMESAVSLTVPLPCKISTGASWAELM